MASYLNIISSIEVIFNYSSVSSDEDFKNIYLLYIVSASIWSSSINGLTLLFLLTDIVNIIQDWEIKRFLQKVQNYFDIHLCIIISSLRLRILIAKCGMREEKALINIKPISCLFYMSQIMPITHSVNSLT